MEKIINDVPGLALHDTSRALGWHHPAIRVGDFVFLSGFIDGPPAWIKGKTFSMTFALAR